MLSTGGWVVGEGGGFKLSRAYGRDCDGKVLVIIGRYDIAVDTRTVLQLRWSDSFVALRSFSKLMNDKAPSEEEEHFDPLLQKKLMTSYKKHYS